MQKCTDCSRYRWCADAADLSLKCSTTDGARLGSIGRSRWGMFSRAGKTIEKVREKREKGTQDSRPGLFQPFPRHSRDYPGNGIFWSRAKKRSWGCARQFRPMVPDFLHEAPPTDACAAFIEESRMKFANARKPDRKSGCTPGRTWGTRPISFGVCDRGGYRAPTTSGR